MPRIVTQSVKVLETSYRWPHLLHQKNGTAKCLQDFICSVPKEVISYSLARKSIFTSNLSRWSHPKRKSNPNPLDNGPLSPLGLVIVIASALIGKQFIFSNVCLYWGCVCELVWVNACVCLFMSVSEWFPSESAFYSRIPPGWVWLFDRTAPWRPAVSSPNEHRV